MPGDFDLVKERTDIVQLIGEHVPLKKAGRIYKALCPFHAEKTPSFTVDPARRTYKCFGCGVGGDVFTFLEQREGLSPAEALERLAERAGLQLERRGRDERDRHARLYAAHDLAYFYFRQALRGTAGGRAAAAYLAKRGVRPDVVERFGLGYAPEPPAGLVSYLRKKGYGDDEAVASGLVVRTDRGELVDRFRDRLMVPIRDARGRLIAFGGRAMRAGQTPKYTNSPATPLFDKSATLYALDAAKGAIRKEREAIVVEGYFDAVAAHQVGVANVVASMGTALTPHQYEALRPLAERAVLAFDADPAGVRAAETRGRELLALADRVLVRAGRGAVTASVGLDLYVAVLPPGMDPDQLVRADPDGFRRAIADAKPVVEFLLDLLAMRHGLSSAQGRRAYLREALPLLAGVSDRITRAVYLDRVAAQTGVAQENLESEVRLLATRGTGASPGASPEKQRAFPERYVIAQLLRYPDHARHVDLSADDFSQPDLGSLFAALARGEPLDRMPAPLRPLAVELRAQADETGSVEDQLRAIELAALRVRERRLRQRLDQARARLARAEGDAGALGAEIDGLAVALERVMQARERHTVLEHVLVETE
jgi:DNA primase